MRANISSPLANVAKNERVKSTLSSSALAVLCVAFIGVVVNATAGEAQPYDEHVKCEGEACKVDLFLTRGFRAFSQCQVCHGLDGAGSTIAPSLLDKLRDFDKEVFMDVVANGKTGQIGVMPPWKDNPNVMKYVENLYVYLLARADGKIPAGKMERFDR